MRKLLIVGGGLFGSLAAAYARQRGLEATIFDAGLPGAASPAAAGLFKEGWIGKKLRPYYECALPLLDRMYGLRRLTLYQDDGQPDHFFFVPPTIVLESNPRRERVERIGDGWLETSTQRHQGCVYVAAGVWSGDLVADV